jgi:hypothetical protein
MIGPVSGTGRAMMASLQQAMAKGMPADQAVQYVKSMAMQGVAPLADLYAMMNQFQRLKQPQAQPPQTPPTIRDQLNMLDQQQQMRGGIGGMQASAPQPSPMDRGLGAIDAGRMEYPQFAGGGVVALAGGGDFDVEQVYSRGKPQGADQFNLTALYQFGEQASPEELARMYAKALSQNDFDTANRLEPVMRRKGLSQDYMNYVRKNTALGLSELRQTKAQEPVNQILYGAAAGAAPTDSPVPPPVAPPAAETPPVRRIAKPTPAAAAPQPTLNESIAEIRKPLIERGLLTAEGQSVASNKFRDYLTGEQTRMEEEFGKDRSLALAEAGFRMAGAASRPGATFLGALSEGGVSYSQAIRGMNKELQANRRQMMQAKYTLDKADELEARGEVEKAVTLRQQAQTRADDLQKHRDNLMVDFERIAATREGTAAQIGATREAAQGRMALAGMGQRLEETQMVAEQLQTDPIYRQLQTDLLKAKKGGDTEAASGIQQQMKQRRNEVRGELGLSAADVTTATRGMEAAGGGRGVTFLGYE